jgi:hypothetical protein
MKLLKIWSLVALLLSIFFLNACATVGGAYQVLKIASHPEGAKVYSEGKLLGETPGFFHLKRARHATILLEKDGLPSTEIPLATSYRWGDSFFSNGIFLYAAPVGWAVDLIDQRAFEFDPLPAIEFKGSKKKRELPKVIAIAPPQLAYELMSDEIGQKMERVLKERFPKAQILPYSKTLQIFSAHSYENTQQTPTEYRDNLYSNLGATNIVESQIIYDDEKVQVNAELKDVYTDETIDKFTEIYDKKDFKSANKSFFSQALATALTAIMPNDLTFDFTTEAIQLPNTSPDNPAPYNPVADQDTSILGYVQGLSLHNVRSPSLYKSTRGVLRLSTGLSLNHQRMHFERPGGINNMDGIGFYWYKVLFGAGPELGVDSSIGYFYLQLLPQYGLNYIYYERAGQGFNSQVYSLNFETELGYRFFLSHTINLRFFLRDQASPASQWNEVMSQASRIPVNVDRATYLVSGLSVGYYFAGARNEVKSWFY